MSSAVEPNIQYERFLDCVHCGLCTSACPTYLETGDENDGPRGRIYLMRSVVDGKTALTAEIRTHLDRCLDCRSCETACPSGVQYGRLIEPFRVAMHQEKNSLTWLQRRLLFGLFPSRRKLRWALAPARFLQWTRLDRLLLRIGAFRLLPPTLRRMQDLLPRLERRPKPLPSVLKPAGKIRARVGLFLGCVSEAMFPEVNRATARVLLANGCEVVTPPEQVCCGAIHYHSGIAKQASRCFATNDDAFPSDLDAIIINVAGCGSMLKDYDHVASELQITTPVANIAPRTRDVCEFLAELGPIEPREEVPLRAVYHDACHLVHAQQVRNQPRALLEQVSGLELLPLAESEICCGAAGSYNLTQTDMADRLAARKLRNILATTPDAVISGNVGCTLQIGAALRNAGRPMPILHPVEILDRAYGESGGAANAG